MCYEVNNMHTSGKQSHLEMTVSEDSLFDCNVNGT